MSEVTVKEIKGQLTINGYDLGSAQVTYEHEGETAPQMVADSGYVNPPRFTKRIEVVCSNADEWQGYERFLKRRDRNLVHIVGSGEDIMLQKCEVSPRIEGETLRLTILCVSYG